MHAAFPTAAVSRPKTSADEQYLEEHAWANPHHPAHQHFHLLAQPQASQQAQLSSSLITPAAQRRLIDRSTIKGSASTIPDETSAPNSSAAVTPVNVAQVSNRQQRDKSFVTDSNSPLGQAKAALSLYGTAGASEGEKSPLGFRKRVPDQTIGEHPSAGYGSPDVLRQASVPMSASIFSTALGKRTGTSHPGIFSEHLGLVSSSSQPSKTKAEDVPDKARTSPTIAHLQPRQGNVITAGAGLGRFAAR